mgnify:CR=1 FL=1
MSHCEVLWKTSQGMTKMCDCGNRGNSACDSGRNCNAAEKEV